MDNDDKLFNVAYMNALAKEVYKKNKNVDQGVDMIEKNHIKPKNITSGMKLFMEKKGRKIISTYFDRIEIREGNRLDVIPTLGNGCNR